MNFGLAGFRPRLVPTLVTSPMVLLCLALGVWQVQRLHWKEGLIAQREAAQSAPPAAAPESLADARRLEYRRIHLSGVPLWDKEVPLHDIGPSGQLGFDVIVPLRQADGRIVLIDQGFAPAKTPTAIARVPHGVGPISATGLLRLAPTAKPSWFLPANDPKRNEWFWVDLPAVARARSLTNLAPFTIEADAVPWPGCLPRSCAKLPELPNHHLQYAITWFSLAGSAVVIYVLAQREGNDDRLS